MWLAFPLPTQPQGAYWCSRSDSLPSKGPFTNVSWENEVDEGRKRGAREEELSCDRSAALTGG